MSTKKLPFDNFCNKFQKKIRKFQKRLHVRVQPFAFLRVWVKGVMQCNKKMGGKP